MSECTRRNFIKRTVAATGTLGFATGCRRLRGTDRPDLGRGAIDRLRAKLKGRLILPADPSYESARRVFYWNAGTERRPRILVQCACEEDALRAVEFARRHELEVAARAGGHSHLGWGCSNGLVMDLSGLKRIAIDPLRRTARVEGGVLSGEVARAAGRHGLAPVLGQCPGVGASGLILGSGQTVYFDDVTYTMGTRPTLTIAKTAPARARLQWSTNHMGFTVRSVFSLDTDSLWQPLPNVVTVNGAFFSVSVGATNTAQFFRLRKP